MYPRTTHSTGSISSFWVFMLRPSNSGVRKNSGMSFVSMESMWFGTMSLVKSNQNLDILFSTAPFSGTGSFKITSNAEIRSVQTMTRLSPRSYSSRTFPDLKGLYSFMFFSPFFYNRTL